MEHVVSHFMKFRRGIQTLFSKWPGIKLEKRLVFNLCTYRVYVFNFQRKIWRWLCIPDFLSSTLNWPDTCESGRRLIFMSYSRIYPTSHGERSFAAVRQLLPHRLASVSWKRNDIHLETERPTIHQTTSRKVVKFNTGSSSTITVADVFS
jgi:hypothetical protein